MHWMLHGFILVVFLTYTPTITDADDSEILDSLRVENKRLLLLVTKLKDLAKDCDRGLLIEIDKQLAEILDHKNPGSTTIAFNNNEHEHLRHKLEYGVEQFWKFLRANFDNILRNEDVSGQLGRAISSLKEGIFDRHQVIKLDLGRLKTADGAGERREAELNGISAIIQNRLHQINHPLDCSTVKKMRCTIQIRGLGFGSMIHHLVDCIIVSYATKRAIVLDSNGWGYDNGGYETIFYPLSDCTIEDNEQIVPWGENVDHAQVIDLPRMKIEDPRPDYMPLAIPNEFANDLTRLHANPAAWWIGQLTKYLIRPLPELMEFVEQSKTELSFEHPIVGVHVRRHDKVLEARLFDIEDYMTRVEEYYSLLSLTETVNVKRVFLATDEVEVLQEAKQKYPDYVFIQDTGHTESASQRNLRSSGVREAIRGIIIDIFLLSQTDYLVCTISSNVGRLAYEIMESQHADATDRVSSLDQEYFTDRQSPHIQRVLYHHDGVGAELDLEPGDEIVFHGTNQDGFFRGTSLRLQKVGFYPAYKVEDIIRTAEFSSYDEYDNL